VESFPSYLEDSGDCDELDAMVNGTRPADGVVVLAFGDCNDGLLGLLGKEFQDRRSADGGGGGGGALAAHWLGMDADDLSLRTDLRKLPRGNMLPRK